MSEVRTSSKACAFTFAADEISARRAGSGHATPRGADALALERGARRSGEANLQVLPLERRFAGERDPYLRARVPRERLLTVWASPWEPGRLEREIAAFAQRLAELRESAPPAEGAPSTPREELRRTAG